MAAILWEITWRNTMPRPTNKQELLELAKINLDKLLDFIDELLDEIRNGNYENNELNDREKSYRCRRRFWYISC
jgi:hypothetical protein